MFKIQEVYLSHTYRICSEIKIRLWLDLFVEIGGSLILASVYL